MEIFSIQVPSIERILKRVFDRSIRVERFSFHSLLFSVPPSAGVVVANGCYLCYCQSAVSALVRTVVAQVVFI